MRWVVRALMIVALALTSASAQAPMRVALIIGNAAYTTPGWELKNPVNDARLIEARLSALGFQVMPLMNGTKAQMEAAMNVFGARLRAGGPDAVGLFYYAGHGVEQDGANLLVPVDVTARSMDELRFQAPLMQFVLRDMARAGNSVNIVVLDACRNLPLPSGTRAGPAGGLADLEDAPPDVLIAYSTRAGLTAPDNPANTNSVFTRTLADALATNPGETVVNLFSEVQARVYSETRHAQRPEFRNGLLRAPDWRFAAITEAAASLPAFDPRQAELAYWNSCCVAGATAADFDGYLAKVTAHEFPGTYADTARRRSTAFRNMPSAKLPDSPLTPQPILPSTRENAVTQTKCVVFRLRIPAGFEREILYFAVLGPERVSNSTGCFGWRSAAVADSEGVVRPTNDDFQYPLPTCHYGNCDFAKTAEDLRMRVRLVGGIDVKPGIYEFQAPPEFAATTDGVHPRFVFCLEFRDRGRTATSLGVSPDGVDFVGSPSTVQVATIYETQETANRNHGFAWWKMR